MSRVITMILMLLLSWTGATAQKIARVELKDLESKFFPFKRTVLIYTPEHYDESTESEYDVIYVFDAQDRSNFDEVHALLYYGLQQPDVDLSYIVVGVASPYVEEYKYDRSNDFLPAPLHWKLDNPEIAGDTSLPLPAFTIGVCLHACNIQVCLISNA